MTKQRRRPRPRTTRAEVAIFIGVLVAGSIVIALIVAACKARVQWTGGFPYSVLASAIPAWAITVLVGIQVWDLIQIHRHGPIFQIERPDERALPRTSRTYIWLPPLIAAAGFMIGLKYW